MNYTRGSWEAVGGSVRDSEHIEICTCSTYQESANANARLIAAAPDMYEALITLKALLQGGKVKVAAEGLPEQITVGALFEQMDKALAKAEGGEA